MATTNKKQENEVGVIGQMYEERKPNKAGIKKAGVLESRDGKFKTLMMRAKDGTSFTVQYSTFRSNWRKYQGEEIIETSTQVEERRVEEKKAVERAEKEAKKVSESPKISAEDKVKIVRALRTLTENRVKDAKYPLEVKPLATGGIIVKLKGKKRTLFELWAPSNRPDVYSFRMREDIDKFVETDETREFIESAINCVRYRPLIENYDKMMSAMLLAVERFVDETGILKKKEEAKEEEK